MVSISSCCACATSASAKASFNSRTCLSALHAALPPPWLTSQLVNPQVGCHCNACARRVFEGHTRRVTFHSTVGRAGLGSTKRVAWCRHQVFTFLPGNWLFVGCVCREWEAVYAGLKDQRVLHLSIYDGRGWRTYGAKSTRYGAAVASPATAKLAFEGSLDLLKDRLQCIAGLCADIQTLAALLELGMPLRSIVVKAVALSGRLSVLQHLLLLHPGLTSLSSVKEEISCYAASSGSIDMLNWLRTQSWCVFNCSACEGAAA
eukprot:19914-Heterococcus_DN1.PRE.1